MGVCVNSLLYKNVGFIECEFRKNEIKSTEDEEMRDNFLYELRLSFCRVYLLVGVRMTGGENINRSYLSLIVKMLFSTNVLNL